MLADRLHGADRVGTVPQLEEALPRAPDGGRAAEGARGSQDGECVLAAAVHGVQQPLDVRGHRIGRLRRALDDRRPVPLGDLRRLRILGRDDDLGEEIGLARRGDRVRDQRMAAERADVLPRKPQRRRLAPGRARRR